MKRSKREENALVIYLILYSVLVIASFIFFNLKTLPQIKEISEKKVITKELHADIVRVEKGWLEFNEFKKMIGNTNKLVSIVVSNMSEEFYTSKLENDGNWNYKDFLENLTKDINGPENKAIIEAKREEIINVLPFYFEDSLELWENVLSDYKFINYIELLIESFNFESNSPIGISNVALLDEFAVKNDAWNTLESNIFYIPLSLTLNWTKAGVIDFLYFIENVWNIKIESLDKDGDGVLEDEVILSGNSAFLTKKWIPKILEWDKYNFNYNIFEHQITDIQKISMTDYMDSSYLTRWDQDFKSFIVDTQWTEEYSINIELMFYVKGQAIYIIEENILSILDNYLKVKAEITNTLKNTDKDSLKYIKLTQGLDILESHSNAVTAMRKELIKKENLEKIFKRALEMDSIFKGIQKI